MNEFEIDDLLERFSSDYKQEVKRLAKSGGVSEKELDSISFLNAVLLLVAEKYVPSRSKAKEIYDNLQHF